MKSLAQLGRYFFAIPFCVFGIQYFLYGHYAGGLSAVPPWAPRVVTHLNNGDEWSSAFVALAMAGASFLLLPSFSERT
jgi:hypothetical protein